MEGSTDLDEYERIYIPYMDYLNGHDYYIYKNVLPYIPQITQGWHDINIRKNFEHIVEKAKQKGILVGNQSWILPFIDRGVNVYGDFGLNVYNTYDVKLYEKMGLKGLCMSLETAFDEPYVLNTDVPVEIIAGGKIPLMVSRHDFVSDVTGSENKISIVDCKGKVYEIQKSDKDGQNVITGYKKIITDESIRKSKVNNEIYFRYFG